MRNLSLATITGLIALSSSLLVADNNPIILDTLIVYSQGSVDKYGGDAETRINHLITTTNKIYQDSGLNVKLNPVKIQPYPMDDEATSGTVLSAIRKDAEVTKIRNEVGADNVVIYRPYAGDGACGLAYQNNYLNDPNATWVEKYAFAHISIDCGAYVTAHEVGHNTGLGHSAKQGSTGAYEYARGHGIQDTFTTIMAYSGVYNAKKIYKYSSPTLDCNGQPCGIEEGEENSADAVKALFQTLPLIEKFREHIIIDDGNDNNNTDDGDDNNNTDNGNNNGDDNNGTIDDSAKKLAEALKAYTDQKTLINEDREELNKFKVIAKEKRDIIKEIRVEYRKQRTVYKEIRSEYKSLREDYKVVIKEYKQARKDYKAKKITKEQFNTVKEKLYSTRDTYKTYYNDILLPTYTALKEFRKNTIQPAIDDYKEARTNYKTFYTDVYKIDRAKLKELRKAYLKLKKEQ